MGASIVHAFVSAKSNGSDGTLIQPSNWNAAHLLSGATQGDLLVAASSTATGSVAAVAAGQVLISNGASVVPVYSPSPTVTTVRYPMTTPGAPINTDTWIDASGVSPARVISLKVRDGGATRTLASITY